MRSSNLIFIVTSFALFGFAIGCSSSSEKAEEISAPRKAVTSTSEIQGSSAAPMVEREAVRTKIHSEIGKFVQCFETRYVNVPNQKKKKRVEGKIVIAWSIDESGRAIEPKVTSVDKPISSRSFQDCMIAQIQALQFDVPKTEPAFDVVYPFHFSNDAGPVSRLPQKRSQQ